MVPSETSSSRNSGSGGSFPTTRWSVVLAAGRRASPESRQALATLCEAYWYPLYAYVRRRGYPSEDAQDFTQEFFTRLLEADAFQVADPQRGKFRSFLVSSLKNFLANQRRDANAQKRGAGQAPLSLDFAWAECRYALEPAHELTPERVYERRWAITLLEQTLARLQEELAASGRQVLFEHLKGHLGGNDDATPYRAIAEKLGMTEGAVKVAVHRLRRRCQDLLREHVAATVADPQEIDDELRALFEAIAS